MHIIYVCKWKLWWVKTFPHPADYIQRHVKRLFNRPQYANVINHLWCKRSLCTAYAADFGLFRKISTFFLLFSLFCKKNLLFSVWPIFIAQDNSRLIHFTRISVHLVFVPNTENSGLNFICWFFEENHDRFIMALFKWSNFMCKFNVYIL